MGEQLVELEERGLAPWAAEVLALDESTLDAVGRWLPELRAALPGDPRLLAGRSSALFDVRRQQWVRVELWQEAVANCKQQARVTPITPVSRCATSSIKGMGSWMPSSGWAAIAPIGPNMRCGWCSSTIMDSCIAT
jgi:hypothetical protein